MINVGTPDEPTVESVRDYLREFLLDPDVIDAPYLIRQILVRGIILRVYLDQGSDDIHLVLSGITVSLSLMCYLIIPATNRATDSGNHRRFNILHKLSVYSTLAILLSNIAFIFV